MKSLPIQNDSGKIEETVLPSHKLTQLRLQQNEISEIEDNSFYGWSNLRCLNLAENQWKVIRRLTFAGLPALDTLILSDNEIERIEGGAFDFPVEFNWN